MSLMTGSKLGPYEIVATLGSDGVREVYRAHDARLDITPVCQRNSVSPD